MRKLLLFLSAICINAHSFDLVTSDQEISFFPDESWKFGVKQSAKEIEGILYLSITVNPKLLCELSSVESQGVQMGGIDIELPVLKAANAYTINFSTKKYLQTSFNLVCKSKSNVHQKSKFNYVAWSAPVV